MGLFDKKSKEEKRDEKLQKFIERYGLDELDDRDYEKVEQIATDLIGKDFMKTGMAISMAKAEEQLKVSYLSVLVEQNWIIMNQLSRISKQLEKK